MDSCAYTGSGVKSLPERWVVPCTSHREEETEVIQVPEGLFVVKRANLGPELMPATFGTSH